MVKWNLLYSVYSEFMFILLGLRHCLTIFKVYRILLFYHWYNPCGIYP